MERYDFDTATIGPKVIVEMSPGSRGDWCKWEDVQPLIDRIAELEAENSRLAYDLDEERNRNT